MFFNDRVGISFIHSNVFERLKEMFDEMSKLNFGDAAPVMKLTYASSGVFRRSNESHAKELGLHGAESLHGQSLRNGASFKSAKKQT
jgi:hypothetical protein